MSFLDKIFGNSKTTKTQTPKGRRLRMESLESRELLSVSAAEFDAIRSQYSDLELSENMGDYNIIEITAAQLSDASLRSAIATASTTAKNDLIVVRTTETQNRATLIGAELAININAQEHGKVAIVSLGDYDLTIDGNEASRVLNISSSSVVGLAGLTITGGVATRGGGIYSEGTLTVTDCMIAENTASANIVTDTGDFRGSGGGIANMGGKLTVTSSVIKENTATVTVATSDIFALSTLINLEMEDVLGDGAGGGIANVGTLIVTNCLIEKNTATLSGGGGIGNFGGTVTVSGVDTIISGNNAGFGGGGLGNLGGTMNVEDAVIKGNFATGVVVDVDYTGTYIPGIPETVDLGGGFGGGIGNSGLPEDWSADAALLTVINCLIEDNHCEEWGGGIGNTSGGTITVTESTFLGNHCEFGNGGGVSNDANILNGVTTAFITNCWFEGNSAVYGGAMSNAGDLWATNCAVVGNSATTNGAINNDAAVVDGWALGTATYTNCTITKNTANNGGGGIGVFVGTVVINNTIVAGNTSNSGIGDVYRAGGSLSGSNSLIGDGTGQTAFTHGTSGNIVGTAAATINPKFVDAANGNYRLATDSLAINQGNNALLPSGITSDLDGNARIVGGRVDMGAYEYGSTPTVPVSPATAKAVSASGGKTQITWSAVSGATSYEIMGYNATGKYWWKIGETSETSYTASAYSAAVTTISVHAKNSAGRSTGKTTSIFRGPAKAAAVAATGNQTKISWNAVAGATSYEIMGYNKPGNYWWKIGTTTDTSFTAPGYTANVTTIAVHAIRGNDRTSGTAASIFRGPGEVSAVAASGNRTQISWNVVAGATSYDIMGYNKAGNYWWKIGTTSDTSFNTNGFTTNVTTIAIHALRGEERSAGSATSIFRGPESVSAVAAASSTNISWSLVPGATSYEIMGFNKAGNYWWSIGTTNGTSFAASKYSADVTSIAVHALRGTERTAGTATTIVR